MKRVLLHICCGVCSAHAYNKLAEDGYSVFGFFSNSNIEPEAEYLKRLDAAKKQADILGFEFIEDEYTPHKWLGYIKGFESEPENGKRCSLCYKFRLEKTFLYAKENGFDYFTTTLTISPHKNSKVINETGISTSKDRFLCEDFKKKDGFKKTIEISKKNGIYRQNYCGCRFSLR